MGAIDSLPPTAMYRLPMRRDAFEVRLELQIRDLLSNISTTLDLSTICSQDGFCSVVS